MNKWTIVLVAILANSFLTVAQNWSLKVTSHIGYRKYLLDTKAIKDETLLSGAVIKLYKGTTLVDQAISDAGGYFAIFVPGNAEYILTVTYTGCFTKRIYINTNNVPKDMQDASFKPSISIEGFILSKPLPGIDYSTLDQTLAKIVYVPKDKNFGDEELYTKEGLALVSRIEKDEINLVNQFCDLNKEGDEALLKRDCALAKQKYESALSLLPAEQYPVKQISKAGDCFKEKEEIARKAEEAEAAKALEEKYSELMAKAEQAFKSDSLTVAKALYTEAIELKKNDQYPQYKLMEVEMVIAEQATLKDNLAKTENLKSKYDAAIKIADELMAKKLWTDAEDSYYEALKYLPNEKFPKTQIVAINKIKSREMNRNDSKCKEAIDRAGILEPEYFNAIKLTYENAITYESDAAYLKKKTNETVSEKSSEHVKAMLAKYPTGLTEEIISGNGVVIVKRILVKEDNVWVYQKKIFNWGGITCFRDNVTITESIFENETKLN